MITFKNLGVLNSLLFISIFFFSAGKLKAQSGTMPDIIPAPSFVKYSKGTFALSSKTKIQLITNTKEVKDIAAYVADQISTLCGIKLTVDEAGTLSDDAVGLEISYQSDKKEAYSFIVHKKNIVINGASPEGLFRGVQTLIQLTYPNNGMANIQIPCMEIKDEPAFAWRGMHLDVCRHFYPVETVKKMIDMLALLKMNVFHWHLTDDQGWRIEIKRYPKLTSVGAWRDGTLIGRYTEDNQKFDTIRYGGFYTQEQIKDVVKYAQSRYITIVPEIEMPGHAVAALAAYPQFSCTGGPFKVYQKWGVSDDVYCAGKEGTFDFLENILDEVIDLFPGPYIHIGGDECPKTRWKACPDCQKRIKDEGLKDELELQSYFVKRIEKFIASKGKKMIGWDEILEGGLPERATVMSWRGYDGGVEAAHTGHDVIMTPGEYCYFDHYQAKVNEPLAIGGYLPLDKVYRFDPVPPTLSTEGAKHILGAQANVWTEYITTEDHLEYMIFPRLCAMSEVLWTPKNYHDYTGFLVRLNSFLKRLDKFGVKYRPVK